MKGAVAIGRLILLAHICNLIAVIKDFLGTAVSSSEITSAF